MSDDSTNLRQEFVTELESILESDEAYGSNLQILTYALKEDVINGKFKDSWNNRVYEFIIDIDGISYKPAAKLDSFGADELPIRFDAYSKGYASLFENGRLDRNLTGKRVKKPKCGNQGYGCGYSCISLLKTCQILSSGKKAGTNQGKAIGQQRLNKLMELSKKLYLAGDTKKAALASTIAGNISKVRTKYNAGGQGLMAERALAKQQVVVKKPESIKSVTAAKLPPKSQEKKPTKSTSDPTTNPKTHSIKTQKEFEDVFYHVVDKLSKKQNDTTTIPINDVREAIGELLPRNKFNEYVINLQADGDIQLQGGGEANNFSRWIKNAIAPSGTNPRYYIGIEELGQSKINKITKSKQSLAEKTLNNRPELDPLGSARQYTEGNRITSQKIFNETAEKVFKALNDEFNYLDLVPIAKVKEVLKDRASRDDLDTMILGFHDNDKHQLIEYSGRSVPPELVDGEIKTAFGEKRHYIMKVNS